MTLDKEILNENEIVNIDIFEEITNACWHVLIKYFVEKRFLKRNKL